MKSGFHPQRIASFPLIKVLAFICVAASAHGQPTTNSLAQLEQLKDPKISSRASEKMLVVEAKGDPNEIGSRVFGLLFQLYYRIPETPKARLQGFPRAHWPQGLQGNKKEWTGIYGLPVPASVTNLPSFEPQEGLSVSLRNWDYGEVAEILHVGPYTREQPTLQRLEGFIKEHGYVIRPGGHEEEYVVGPGRNSKGDPEKYMTVLRYRIEKAKK